MLTIIYLLYRFRLFYWTEAKANRQLRVIYLFYLNYRIANLCCSNGELNLIAYLNPAEIEASIKLKGIVIDSIKPGKS